MAIHKCEDCIRLKAAADQYRGEADRCHEREAELIVEIARLQYIIWQEHQYCFSRDGTPECCGNHGWCWQVSETNKKKFVLLEDACDVCKNEYDKRGGKL